MKCNGMDSFCLSILILWSSLLSRCSCAYGTQIGGFWQGFSKLDTLFAFGDSWTTTGFNAVGPQPSASNPLGNPTFPGETTTNGANYVGYLVSKYNQSTVMAYDLAVGGAVIDPDLDHPMLGWLSFQVQVAEFKALYTGANQNWKPENTLFSTFFGINDVVIFNRSDPQLDVVFETYAELIGNIYDLGGRNFMLINVPPVDVISATQPKQYVFPGDVYGFNININSMVQKLAAKYTDMTIIQIDIHTLIQEVIGNPSSHSETAGYVNVNTNCQAYADNLKTGKQVEPSAEQIASCGGLLPQQYLWLDSLHTSWPIHDAMANLMSSNLASTPAFAF